MEIYRDQIYEELKAGSEDVELLNLPYKAPLGRIGRAVKKYWEYARFIDNEVQRHGPDTIVYHLDHGYAHLVNKRHQSVVTVHDLTHFAYPELSGPTLWFWRKRMSCLKNAKHLVAISEDVSQLLQKHLQIPEERITVNYHEVNPQKFIALDREQAKSKWNKPLKRDEIDLLVASVGTQCPKKNLGVLLSAIQLLREQGINVLLVRMGDLIKDSEWAKLADNLRADGLLLELGYLKHSEVAEVLSVCDVLSFPSLYEGFGMPIMEAQCLGIPVVAAKASCLPEVAGEGALFHDPDDAEDLANALLKVHREPGLRADLVSKGQVNVDRFKKGSHIETLKKVFEKLESC